MTANIGTGLLAGGAILLLIGVWFAPAVATRSGQVGLALTAVGALLIAYAISWVPLAVVAVVAGTWYTWLVRAAHRDRVKLLRFLETARVYAHGPVWCLGLTAGADPFAFDMATVVAAIEAPTEVRERVIPTAQRQARWSWCAWNAARLYLSPTNAAKTRPHPFHPGG